MRKPMNLSEYALILSIRKQLLEASEQQKEEKMAERSREMDAAQLRLWKNAYPEIDATINQGS